MKKLIFILISIILGITYGGYFNSYLLNISLLFCIICCYLLFFKINSKLRIYNRVYIYCIFMILFSFYTTYRYKSYEETFKENIDNTNYVCEILSLENYGEKYNKYIGKITNVNDIRCNKKIYVYLDNSKIYRYGDIIKCKINMEKPIENRNDGGFNNKLYCYSNNIYAIGYVENIIELTQKKNILTYIYNSKDYLCNKIITSFNNEAGVLISIILGDDKYLSKQEKDIFSNSNLSHILVVSGTHLAYLLFFSKYLFQRFNIKDKVIDILNIFIILIYLVLNNFGLSILRASIMYIISIIYRIRNKNKNNLEIILKLIIVFLIINPLYIFNISLILSFVSILSIQLLNNRVENKLQYNLNNRNSKLIKSFIQSLSVSICVQIVIIPILSIYFHKLYITSILSSVIAIPISSVIIIVGIIYCMFCYIPLVSNILCLILKLFIFALKIIAIYFSNLPLANINIYPFRCYEIIVYYFIVYTIFINNYPYIYLKRLIKIAYKIVKRKIIRVMVGIVIISSILVSIIYSNNYLKIDFIDVGQGDCICIRVLGKNILIDGGNATESYDNGEMNILPFLLYNRIDKLDYIIISHFDSDHINGLISVINNYSVENILFSENIDIGSQEYCDFMSKLDLKKVKIKTIKNNDRINFSEKVFIDFYTTDKNTYITENESNNNSLVCRLNYYSFKAIFMGDAEAKQEELLIKNNDISAHLIKIGHHGSKSSTAKQFLAKVNPKIAVIQVGENFYGHPHNEVLELIEKQRCLIYRNDINGQIKLKINKYGNIKIKTKLYNKK